RLDYWWIGSSASLHIFFVTRRSVCIGQRRRHQTHTRARTLPTSAMDSGAKPNVGGRKWKRSQSTSVWSSLISRLKTPAADVSKDPSPPVRPSSPSKIASSAHPTLRNANTLDYNQNTVIIRPSRRSPRPQDKFFSRRSLTTFKELFDNRNGNNL